MKKIFSLFFVVCLILSLSLTACKNKTDTNSQIGSSAQSENSSDAQSDKPSSSHSTSSSSTSSESGDISSSQNSSTHETNNSSSQASSQSEKPSSSSKPNCNSSGESHSSKPNNSSSNQSSSQESNNNSSSQGTKHYIKLSKTQITVEEGKESERIGIEFSISQVNDNLVVFNMSDNSIASVSWKGAITNGFYVTGLKAGTTTITITNFDQPGASATLKVTVTKRVNVSGISLNKNHIDGKVGKVYPLTATITPSNAQDKTVLWSSSNASVATVNTHGDIIAKSAGKATITATTRDGNFKATCTITVTNIEVTGIEITTKPLMNYHVGDTLQLKYKITPYDATNQKVIWKSSDTSMATVSSTGLVTFKKGIEAKHVTITVTTEDGKYSDSVRLYCVPQK